MRFLVCSVLALCFACATAPARKPDLMTATATLPQAARLLAGTPAAFTTLCDTTLADAARAIAALKQLPPGDDAKKLALYDEATTALSNATARSGLAHEVHPDVKFREAAEACEQRLEAFSVELAQDQALSQALKVIDVTRLDAITTFWLSKTLRDFRRAGVDGDEAKRAKVKALNDQLVKLGQAFGRNIRDDVREVKVPPADLEGLPKDWLDAHPAGPDGLVTVTTNSPDLVPTMLYAKKTSVREALWRASRQRAFPKNVEVLNTLLRTRHELATLLSYASWADYALETKMAKTGAAAAAFIEQGRLATERRAKADMAVLLTRKQKDQPGATAVEPWEQDFYEDRVKNEQYGLDSQALRAYFEYDTVKRGVMDITSKLFGVRYVQQTDATTWHPDVETYDVYEGETRLGRFHLDMHPREGKYKHAAQFGLTVGRLGKELPEAVLVCNFPAAGGLLQHSDVETFFHEFGHLLHELFAGRQPWGGVSGIRTEWDFVEVPSMLLQEWPLDAQVLSQFARHHQTGQVIPAALVQQLKTAREFGVGLQMRRQFFLSAVSLAFHDRPPGFDPTEVLKTLQTSFAPFRREWAEGTHFELGFGHLDGYSAAYYTYQWSTVIAKDLLTRFGRTGLLNHPVATEYRKKVLEPGGSKEAAALVQDFLGRPSSFEAFRAWLDGNAAP